MFVPGDDVLSQAAALCSTGSSAPTSRVAALAAVLPMIRTEYSESPEWEVYLGQVPGSVIQFYETGTAPESVELRSLVCIEETRELVGSYYGGTHAYLLHWAAVAMTWPDGQTIAVNSFTGGAVPEAVVEGTDKYGQPPKDALASWVDSLTGQ